MNLIFASLRCLNYSNSCEGVAIKPRVRVYVLFQYTLYREQTFESPQSNLKKLTGAECLHCSSKNVSMNLESFANVTPFDDWLSVSRGRVPRT
jgi:hypothetical protein